VTFGFVARDRGSAGVRGARFQAVFSESSPAGIGWNLWGMLPRLLSQERRVGMRETVSTMKSDEPCRKSAKGDESVAKRRRRAAEQMHGMFAQIAPGASLADELIADRRAEVRAEERAEAERRRSDD